MILKLILFLTYTIILFLLARILETLTWIEVGNLSRHLLDPMTMSVMKLKALLDQRGISYEGAIEKQELVDLVESSGSVADDAETNSEDDTTTVTVTNFTTGTLFEEHVEDSKDSVWLVYIIPDQSHLNYLADTSWNLIKHKMSRFEVNTGIFDCSLDPRYCARRNWNSNCLILGLPEEFQTKSRVTLFKYNGPFKVNSIHTWIKESMSNKVEVIDSLSRYKNKWLKYKGDQSEISVAMVSKYTSIPLFYSSVSVKFPGRVKFGFINAKTTAGIEIIKSQNNIKVPSYLVITKEHIFIYGQNFGEDLTFRSMERFLKSLYPGINDIFVLSLLICNCLTLYELSLTNGTLLKRLMKFTWCIVKFNMCLLLVWISLLTLLQIPLMHNLITLSLKLLRLCRLSTLGFYIYKDYCFYSNHIIFTEISFGLYLVLIAYVYHRVKGLEEEEVDIEADDWNFAQFRTLEHLFSPTAGLFRTAGIPAIDPERVHMRDIPTLRQVCNVPDNYINNLQKWQFKMDKLTETGNSEQQDKICNTDKTNEKSTCSCPAESKIPDQCQSCIALRDNHESQNKKSKKLGDKAQYFVNKVKSMDPSTDQSDTDQEKDGTDDDRGIDKDYVHLEDSQCVICLEDYNVGVWLCGLPCGHSFHQSCINMWLSRDNHYCPVCRWCSYTPKPSALHLHSE